MEKIKWVMNGLKKTDDKHLQVMSLENVASARQFHESFPQYERTPLVSLSGMATQLGLANFFVKDESYRFGLNAFKVLGGSFAMANYIAEQTSRPIADMSYDYLTSTKLKEEFGQATFFTATDGNHGRGLAWAANKLGQKCVVLMPKGSAKSRFDNIAKEGAQVTIEEVNYDECVRRANAMAEKSNRGVMVQDTAWEGYEKIPSWIMQGYGTMASEAAEQLKKAGINRPTHIFVQAGVGSLAGAVQGYFANLYANADLGCPTTVIMEARVADCIYRSACTSDGHIENVGGDLQTIMAGLACGEPNTISWDILKNHSSAFVSCSDSIAALGMRMLAAPVKGDPSIVSGESGAVGMGFIANLMTNAKYSDLRDMLNLDKNSTVLMFSTEGDTDRENWERIVWEGLNVN